MAAKASTKKGRQSKKADAPAPAPATTTGGGSGTAAKKSTSPKKA